MSAYLLNLTFDLQSSTTANGLFNDSTTNPPDDTSKMWYPIPANWPPNGNPSQGGQVNAAAPPFSNGISDENGLSCELDDMLYIRFAARNWSGVGDLSLSFSAAFGRTAPDEAVIASPFVLYFGGQATNFPQTTYGSGNMSPIQGGWIIYLGTLTQNYPGRGSGSNPQNYTFIVTAEAEDDENLLQYGHDPTIVVGEGK